MRFWMFTWLILISFCGISTSQDLSIAGFVHGTIEIDPGSSSLQFVVTVYNAGTEYAIVADSGSVISSVNYKTGLYNIGAGSGYPLVDVECIISNNFGQIIYSDTVYDVESVYYHLGGADVDFDFTDASQYYGTSAPVDEPAYLTTSLDNSTWAELKAAF